MRVYFHTLGCKVNQYETAALRGMFAERGYECAEDAATADVVVVNSCTVTAESDRKTRQAVRRLRRECPGAVLVLCGCYSQAWPEAAGALPEADIVLGAGGRSRIADAVERFLADRQRIVEIAPHTRGEGFEPMSAQDFGERTRAFLKIEDGCENRCAYCIIPDARGFVRSKPPEEIASEVRQLAADGRREIVLTGINLSAYGRDIGGSFAQAARLVCSAEGIERVRFGSIEPDTLTSEDIRTLAEDCGGKVCPQFHLSLQSGSDGVLRRMGRRYRAADYRRVAADILRFFPSAALTTDMMVGFPGETDTEHAESLAFAEEIAFAKIHVFAYSQRPGTPAAAMPQQVPQAVKHRRSAELIALADRLRRARLAGIIGSRTSVLFESRHSSGQTGYTPDYTPVAVPEFTELRGEIHSVLITGVTEDGEGCLGVLAD